MSRISNVRRILRVDYEEDQRDLIDKLGEILNRFMDEVVGTVNGNIDFDNLNQEVRTFSMTVDEQGVPVGNDKFRIDLGRASGFIVLSARNKDFSSVYPTSQPFISFTFSGQIIRVLNISGLQAGNEYDLTVQVIGI